MSEENNISSNFLKFPYTKPQLLESELNKLVKDDKFAREFESNNGVFNS